MKTIEIIPYSDGYEPFIKTLNVEWLEKYFYVEPNDEIQLSNPREEIIAKGGLIFFALYHNRVVGTATLMKVDNVTFELSKMAVTEEWQGLGIGKKLLEHCLAEARKAGIKSLVLYSNTRLETAVALYYRYGFVEVPFDSTRYKRANIKMELKLPYTVGTKI